MKKMNLQMIKKVALGLVISVAGLSQINNIEAQDLNTHYSYQLNWFNVNPAYTGETDGIQTMLNQRAQWTGVDGAPVNSMIGIHTGVKDNMGVGGKVILDRRGLLSNVSAEFNYAYKIQLNETSKVSFGMSFGIFQTYLQDRDLFNDRFTDFNDPAINRSYINNMHLLTSFGAMYKSKNLELGLSAPHMATTSSGLSDHLLFMTRYRIAASDKFSIQPSLVAHSLSQSPEQLDIGVKFEYDSLVWAQFIYKTTGNMAPAVGLNMKQFNFAYSYDITQQPINVLAAGAHEVFITFTFDKRKSAAGGAAGRRRSKHLKEVLNNLDNMDTNGGDSELQTEVKGLQDELTVFIKKMETEPLSESDLKRMDDIEKRIIEINSK